MAGGYGLAGFGTLSGGWSRLNTGSHVDMNSLSLMTGLSYGVELKPGYLTLGAFRTGRAAFRTKVHNATMSSTAPSTSSAPMKLLFLPSTDCNHK
jgi:hypothetical protein